MITRIVASARIGLFPGLSRLSVFGLAAKNRSQFSSSHFVFARTRKAVDQAAAAEISAPVIAMTQKSEFNSKELPLTDYNHEWKLLGVPQAFIDRLREKGIQKPTEIQEKALEILMKGRSKNVLMQANTGTGKTIAFLLPILTRLTEDKPTPFHDIIVTPTRELAAQIYHEAIALLNPKLAKCVMAVLPPERSFEGDERDSAAAFKEVLQRKPAVIITTPLRGYEMMASEPIAKQIRANVRTVVVDEIDRIIAPLGKFAPQKKVLNRKRHPKPGILFLQHIFKGNPSCQLIGVAATINATLRRELKVKEIAQSFEMVKAGVDHMPAQSLTHRYVIASNRRKVSRLVQLFEESGEKLKRALVLIGGQSRINDFVAALQERGIKAVALHAQLDRLIAPSKFSDKANEIEAQVKASQESRQHFLDQFKKGEIQALVATEANCRGLDFPSLEHVIIMELPNTPTEYVHMAGRTGRVGKPGEVISFIDPLEVPRFKRITHFLKLEMARMKLTSDKEDDVDEEKIATDMGKPDPIEIPPSQVPHERDTRQSLKPDVEPPKLKKKLPEERIAEAHRRERHREEKHSKRDAQKAAKNSK